MKVVVANAWSITMLDGRNLVKFAPATLIYAQELVRKNEVESIIGHEGTAKVFSQILGIELPARRVFYKMKEGEVMLIGSLSQRLPEGKVLTEEELKKIPIQWWVAELVKEYFILGE